MSTYLQSYRVGTLSVANGSTSVTGTTTLWLANVLAGDLIIVGSTLAEVASVESNTALTLVSGWTGTTVTGSAYVIHRWSRGWLQAGTTALLLADYVSRIPTFIPTTGAPSDAVGSPGNIAVDTSANVFYVKGATTWGSAVSMVGPAGELTRLNAVAGGDLAAWTGANSGQIRKATAAEVRAAGGGLREKVASARIYYVRTDGSDTNDGLSDSPSGAKQTISAAVAEMYRADHNGTMPSIYIGDGTYAERITLAGLPVGATSVRIRGGTTSDSVKINQLWAISNAVGSVDRHITLMQSNGLSSSSGARLSCVGTAVLKFETGTAMSISTFGTVEINYANVVIKQPVITIVNNDGGIFNAFSATITLEGVNAWPSSGAFYSIGRGYFWLQSATFVGSATGRRASLGTQSWLNTAGAGETLIPGTLAATVAASAVIS